MKPSKKDKSIKMPVCPYCEKEMKMLKYRGYYDEFDCWICQCDNLPTDNKDINS